MFKLATTILKLIINVIKVLKAISETKLVNIIINMIKQENKLK